MFDGAKIRFFFHIQNNQRKEVEEILLERQIPVVLVLETDDRILESELTGEPLATEVAAIESGAVLVACQTLQVVPTRALESQLECHLVADKVFDCIDGVLLGGAYGDGELCCELLHLQACHTVKLIG